MNRPSRSSRGIALGTVLLIMVLLLVVAFALANQANGSLNISRSESNSEEVYQAAMAGQSEAKSLLQSNSNWSAASTFIPTAANSYDARSPQNAFYRLQVIGTPSNNLCTIQSTGFLQVGNRTSVVTANYSQGPGGGGVALFGTGGVNASGNVTVDSWNSSKGTYANTVSTNPNNVMVGTNSIAAGAISANGNVTINANAEVGPNANLNTAISAPAGSITGTEGTLGTALSFTPPSPPPGPILPAVNGAPPGGILPPGNYDSLSLGSQDAVTLTSGTYYFANGVSLKAQANINIDSTAGPVKLLFGGTFDAGGGTLTNSSAIPSNFQVEGTSQATNVIIHGNGQYFFVLEAPTAAITVGGTPDIFGTIVGQSIDMHGTVGIHYDDALNGTIPGLPGGPLKTMSILRQ